MWKKRVCCDGALNGTGAGKRGEFSPFGRPETQKSHAQPRRVTRTRVSEGVLGSVAASGKNPPTHFSFPASQRPSVCVQKWLNVALNREAALAIPPGRKILPLPAGRSKKRKKKEGEKKKLLLPPSAGCVTGPRPAVASARCLCAA